MSAQLIISRSPWDLRVALVENGRLAEVAVVYPDQQDPTGNIYKGRVLKVIPGLAAAFVDVGLERPAYLFAQDVSLGLEEFWHIWLKEEGLTEPPEVPRKRPGPPLMDLLAPGQELLVQVSRASSESKGARLTTHISLPGRFLVYLPNSPHQAVSRRLTSEAERERLKQVLAEIKPEEGGLIARTASEGRSREDLLRERDELLARWQKIRLKQSRVAAPALVHQELPPLRRLVRDLLSPGLEQILVDDPTTHQELLDYLKPGIGPGRPRVELYSGTEPLFSHLGLELDWQRLLARNVWLKSGGFLRIDPTEALTAIDVNTGRYTGGEDLEETVLKTDLEAAREIARQLRLRNLGGLIVIDFIDLENAEHRRLVHQTLEEALVQDRARTVVYPMSPLGLVEMTRQKLRESLEAALTTPCPCCQGQGRVLHPRLLAHDLLRQLAWEVREFPGCRLRVAAHPEVLGVVKAEGAEFLQKIQENGRVRVELAEDPHLPRDRFELTRELQ